MRNKSPRVFRQQIIAEDGTARIKTRDEQAVGSDAQHRGHRVGVGLCLRRTPVRQLPQLPRPRVIQHSGRDAATRFPRALFAQKVPVAVALLAARRERLDGGGACP